MTAVHTLVVALLFPLTSTVYGTHHPREAQIPAEFAERVAAYVEVHRRAAAGFGDPMQCADPEELFRQAQDLAAVIREARPLAVEGDVFTSAVASAFRWRVIRSIRQSRSEAPSAVPAPTDDDIDLQVNGALPWGVGHFTWPALDRELPLLPAELEYRLVGRHLVLLDVPANLIVDVLRNAVPAAPRTPALTAPTGPCLAHPELPSCWS